MTTQNKVRFHSGIVINVTALAVAGYVAGEPCTSDPYADPMFAWWLRTVRGFRAVRDAVNDLAGPDGFATAAQVQAEISGPKVLRKFKDMSLADMAAAAKAAAAVELELGQAVQAFQLAAGHEGGGDNEESRASGGDVAAPGEGTGDRKVPGRRKDNPARTTKGRASRAPATRDAKGGAV